MGQDRDPPMAKVKRPKPSIHIKWCAVCGRDDSKRPFVGSSHPSILNARCSNENVMTLEYKLSERSQSVSS